MIGLRLRNRCTKSLLGAALIFAAAPFASYAIFPPIVLATGGWGPANLVFLTAVAFVATYYAVKLAMRDRLQGEWWLAVMSYWIGSVTGTFLGTLLFARDSFGAHMLRRLTLGFLHVEWTWTPSTPAWPRAYPNLPIGLLLVIGLALVFGRRNQRKMMSGAS